MQLQEDFPALKVIKLEQNYRSTGRILAAANQLIDNNPHLIQKALWSELGSGDPLRFITSDNEEREAERVVNEIIDMRLKDAVNTVILPFSIAVIISPNWLS